MIEVTGINNTSQHAGQIVINGAHIHVSGKPIRSASNATWYDEKHTRVMDAAHELERALKALIDE